MLTSMFGFEETARECAGKCTEGPELPTQQNAAVRIENGAGFLHT